MTTSCTIGCAGIRFGSSLHETPVVICLSGELDLGTVPMIECALAAAYRPGTDLVLDLSALTFCDCAGIRMLTRTAHRYTEHGCVMRLAAPQGSVRTVLSVLGIDAVVPVHATTAGARLGDDRDRIGASQTDVFVPGGRRRQFMGGT